MKNVLTTEAFADWCDKQPTEKEYDYSDENNCACGQYAKHIGFVAWRGQSFYGRSRFWWAADNQAWLMPHTFGALAARLRGA